MWERERGKRERLWFEPQICVDLRIDMIKMKKIHEIYFRVKTIARISTKTMITTTIIPIIIIRINFLKKREKKNEEKMRIIQWCSIICMYMYIYIYMTAMLLVWRAFACISRRVLSILLELDSMRLLLQFVLICYSPRNRWQ